MYLIDKLSELLFWKVLLNQYHASNGSVDRILGFFFNFLVVCTCVETRVCLVSIKLC